MRAWCDYTPERLAADLAEWGFNPSHARRLLRDFYLNGQTPSDSQRYGWRMIERLKAEITPLASRLSREVISDDSTRKLLISFPTGGAAECVLMPSTRPGTAAGCVSSQIGCAMGCDFCASTQGGLERNLTSSEIVEQFVHLKRAAMGLATSIGGADIPVCHGERVGEADIPICHGERIGGANIPVCHGERVGEADIPICHGERIGGADIPVCHGERYSASRMDGRTHRMKTLVFMGMGEPMHNLDNVIPAIRRIADPEMGGLGWRQVTVSTVGIVPGIDALAAADMNVHLALSLHAPDDETRAKLVPMNRRYPVAEIIDAAKRFYDRTGRVVTIEYCLLAGVNDSADQADLLADLLSGFRAHVNVIPYNPIGAGVSGSVYVRPSPENVESFIRRLRLRGIVTHPRRTVGNDVDAACGQLRRQTLVQLGKD